MKLLKSMKVGTKLMLGFISVTIISAIIGGAGVIGINSTGDSLELIAKRDMPGIKHLLTIDGTQMGVITGERGLISRRFTGEVREAQYGWIEKQMSRMNESIGVYEALSKGEIEQRIWNEYKVLLEEWESHDNNLIRVSKKEDALVKRKQEGNNEEIKNLEDEAFEISLQSRGAYLKSKTKLDELIAVIDKNTSESLSTSMAEANYSRSVIIILAVIGIIVSLLLGIFIANGIKQPVSKVLKLAESLKKGHIRERANVEAKDEIGQMALAMDQFAEGLEMFVMTMHKVSEGDVTQTLEIEDKDDLISPAFNKITHTLRELKKETDMLTEAAVEGQLDTKGNADKFEGGYREIVDGFNKTIEAIVGPIRESEKVLEVLASGDLTARLEGEYRGNYRRLQQYVNNLGESLDNVIYEVNEAVHATASASSEISSSAEQMASGAQEQSVQTSEVATAVEQMTSTILQTSQNASSASESAKKSGEIATEGGEVVIQTVSGMNRIAEVVQRAANMVNELGKSSDQIGEIIQVIDDIADQTNLLALNAAIEAARAGEQGRGFAVVADEVRKLAERTTKATKEIESMIKQIQEDTSDAVSSISEGTDEVAKGRELANKAGDALKEIITSSKEVEDLIGQVAVAGEEQSSAAEQISKNIEAITSVSHESAAGTQQIARAAEDLNNLTDNLQNIVEKFRISNDRRAIKNNYNELVAPRLLNQ